MAETNESPENLEGEQPAQPVNTEPREAPPHTGDVRELDRDARMWAMFCHLAGVGGLLPVIPVIGSIIAPLVIWQIKKDDYDFVDDQGKEAVNFQISVLLYALVAGLLCFACVGVGLLLVVYGLDVVFLVIAAIKANDGRHYRYPLTIRFIK
ncbi:MAG: DUF4870 domain-containing protein [Phycisphaerales bacterium]|nr:MAG: DUF4870 domain-containing protein [Phycisphaerales bacterium]